LKETLVLVLRNSRIKEPLVLVLLKNFRIKRNAGSGYFKTLKNGWFNERTDGSQASSLTFPYF
jgi:hypothetical protein